MSDWFSRWWNSMWSQRQEIDHTGEVNCRYPFCHEFIKPDLAESSGWFVSPPLDPVTGQKIGQAFLCPKHKDGDLHRDSEVSE